MSKQRAEFMPAKMQEKLKGVPRTHANMIRLTQVTKTVKETVQGPGGKEVHERIVIVSPGVARPGKTAKDRANRKTV
jgi:hypothetical protein